MFHFSKKFVDEHIEDTLCMHTICTADSKMHAITLTKSHCDAYSNMQI